MTIKYDKLLCKNYDWGLIFGNKNDSKHFKKFITIFISVWQIALLEPRFSDQDVQTFSIPKYEDSPIKIEVDKTLSWRSKVTSLVNLARLKSNLKTNW